jgi:hypothetical protein
MYNHHHHHIVEYIFINGNRNNIVHSSVHNICSGNNKSVYNNFVQPHATLPAAALNQTIHSYVRRRSSASPPVGVVLISYQLVLGGPTPYPFFLSEWHRLYSLRLFYVTTLNPFLPHTPPHSRRNTFHGSLCMCLYVCIKT